MILIKQKYLNEIRSGRMTISEARGRGLLTESDPALSPEGYRKNDSLDVAIDKFLNDAAVTAGEEIDAVSFASEIARIVENSDNLLDIKGTIVRRALNYITKTANLEKSNSVKDILQGNFDIVDTGEDNSEDISGPYAKGAGPEVA